MSAFNIGIVCKVEKNGTYKLNVEYLNCLVSQGVKYTILPYETDKTKIAKSLFACNGVMFVGGGDLHPFLYGESILNDTVIIDNERDKIDFLYLEQVLNLDIPSIYICRGLQLLNVFLGGTLYQDLPTQLSLCHSQVEPRVEYSHTIHLSPYLKTLSKNESVKVNSFHHQAIKDLAPTLQVLAYSEDNIIESVKSTKHKYAIGYQFHPEILFSKDEFCQSIIKDFLSHCKTN